MSDGLRVEADKQLAELPPRDFRSSKSFPTFMLEIHFRLSCSGRDLEDKQTDLKHIVLIVQRGIVPGIVRKKRAITLGVGSVDEDFRSKELSMWRAEFSKVPD